MEQSCSKSEDEERSPATVLQCCLCVCAVSSHFSCMCACVYLRMFLFDWPTVLGRTRPNVGGCFSPSPLPRRCCHRPPSPFLFGSCGLPGLPPLLSIPRQDVGLLRDPGDAGGGGGLEKQGGYRVLPFSPSIDLWGLSPSLNICLSPCTVGD